MAEWVGFEFVGRLGAGTAGTVWSVRQLSVGRRVALKELAPELAADPAVRERLRSEAQLLARLDHPNCVAVYALGSPPPSGPCQARCSVSDGGTSTSSRGP